MRQNQKNRYNGRYNNNRGSRPQMIFRNTALDSNGPCGKLHGTALQLAEKYQGAAKDAQIQNDAVAAETCLQFADHYMRLQNIAIANEESQRTPVHNQNRGRSDIPVSDTLKGTQTPETAPLDTTVTPMGTDELPDFTVPVLEVAQTHELSAEDEALKNMDLSIPILAIQEKHGETPTKPQTTRGRGRKPKKIENQL